MGNIKGSSVLFLKKTFQEKGALSEETFLASLPVDIANIYKSGLAFNWFPIEHVCQLFETSSKIIFPLEPSPLRALGKVSAKHDLNGIYKVFVRFATIPYVLGQAARLWKNYHNEGEASVEKDPHQNRVTFILKNYPDFPKTFQESMCGYISEVIELTGARNVNTNLDKTDRNAFKWITTWN